VSTVIHYIKYCNWCC